MRKYLMYFIIAFLSSFLSFSYSITLQTPIEPWTLTDDLYDPGTVLQKGYVQVNETNGLVIYNGKNIYRKYTITPPDDGTIKIYIKDINGNDQTQSISYSVSQNNSYTITINKALYFNLLPKRLFLIVTYDCGWLCAEKVIHYEPIYVIENGQTPQNRIIYTLSYIHSNIGMQITSIKSLIDYKLQKLGEPLIGITIEIMKEYYLKPLTGALASFDSALSLMWNVIDALNSAKALADHNIDPLIKFAIQYGQLFMCTVDSTNYLNRLLEAYNSLWALIIGLHKIPYTSWRDLSISLYWENAGTDLYEYLILLEKYQCHLDYNVNCDWSGIDHIIFGNPPQYSGGIYFWAKNRIFLEFLYIVSKVLNRSYFSITSEWQNNSVLLCSGSSIDPQNIDSEMVRFLNNYALDKLIFGEPPVPIINNITYPSTGILKGSPAIIIVEATNNGADATYGSITISFPYLNDLSAITVQSNGGLNVIKKLPGDTLYNNRCSPITANYPIIEFGGRWLSGETKRITISIDTSALSTGPFTFYVRSTMTSVNDFWCHYFNYPQNSTNKDQQNWNINVYSFDIITNPPTGSITINNNDTYTKSRQVALLLSVSDDFTPSSQIEMCIKNSPSSCYSYNWKLFSSTKSWYLPAGDGNKCVYVKFRDTDGNVSNWFSDCIILDTQPPTTPNLTATAGDGRVTLSWSATSDSTSGFKNFVLRRSTNGYPSCTSGTRIYSGTGTSYTDTGLTNGVTYYYRLCAYDNAGNYSSNTASATPQITKYTLTVNKSGSGTVTSNPAGINCGTTCSAQLNRGTSVTLTATPANGYYFNSWSGCDFTSGNKCTVTMNSNRTVSVTFSACTYSLSPTSKTFNYKNGTGSFSVSTNSACSWTAISNCSWVTITSRSSGTGNGTVSFSVAANTGTAQRSCSIYVGGKTFTVIQDSNQSPTTPTITGSNSGQTGQALSFTANSSDPEGDSIQYRFDWGDGNTSNWGNATQSHTWTNAGNYCVKAQAKDSNGAISGWSSCLNVTISAPLPSNNSPVINIFSANPDQGTAPLTVTFSWDVSDPDGDILTCRLDVDGDGNVEYTINDCANNTFKQHTYNNPSNYTAVLTVDDGKGGTANQQINISVSSPPVNNPPVISSFNANPNQGNVPLTVTFSWNISDPDVDTLTCYLDVNSDGSADYTISDCANNTSQQHTYTNPGNYTATLTIDDGKGAMVSQQVSVTATSPTANNPPAINSFSVNPSFGTTPLTVTFSWNVSDPDGDTLTCTLDINNDGVDDYTINDCANSTSQTHTYNNPGTYTAKLKVSDRTDTVQKTVTITVTSPSPSNNPPVINYLYADPASGTSPLTVFFIWDISDPDRDTLTCILDPGDGSPAYTINNCANKSTIYHIYSNPGNYIAILTVDDGKSGIVNQSVNVVVNAPENNLPIIDYFFVNTDSGSVPLSVDFTCSAYDYDGSVVEYRWDFDGDGTIDLTTSEGNATYTYTSTGIYAAECIAVDDKGAISSMVIYIHVYSSENSDGNTDDISLPGKSGCSMVSQSTTANVFFGWLLNFLFPFSIIWIRRFLRN